MWYKISKSLAPTQNIALENKPSSIMEGSGFQVDFPTATKIQQSLQSHNPLEFSTTDGKKFLVLHGVFQDGKQYFDVGGGNSVAEDDLANWMREHGYDPSVDQIIACGVGNVNPNSGLNAAVNLTGTVGLTIPQTADPEGGPVTIGVQKG
jgi:hypothetical protein